MRAPICSRSARSSTRWRPATRARSTAAVRRASSPPCCRRHPPPASSRRAAGAAPTFDVRRSRSAIAKDPDDQRGRRAARHCRNPPVGGAHSRRAAARAVLQSRGCLPGLGVALSGRSPLAVFGAYRAFSGRTGDSSRRCVALVDSAVDMRFHRPATLVGAEPAVCAVARRPQSSHSRPRSATEPSQLWLRQPATRSTPRAARRHPGRRRPRSGRRTASPLASSPTDTLKRIDLDGRSGTGARRRRCSDAAVRGIAVARSCSRRSHADRPLPRECRRRRSRTFDDARRQRHARLRTAGRSSCRTIATSCTFRPGDHARDAQPVCRRSLLVTATACACCAAQRGVRRARSSAVRAGR